jgi:hypothetical protein
MTHPARRCATAAVVLTALALGPAGSVSATAATPPTPPTPTGTAPVPTATLTGTVHQPGTAAGLQGMTVQVVDTGCAQATASGCTTTATTGAGGRFTISNLVAAGYDVSVLDGSTGDLLATVTLSAGAARSLHLTLPAPAVPAGTTADNSARDLQRLNAERVANGLPGGVVLNPRWSTECAAHDDYERAAGVLDPSEDPTATLASTGGAWAGLNGDLAEGTWTAGATPWQSAPVHLLALLAPSLSVTGIDDSDGLQCAITWPGMDRTPVTRDTVSTVPGPGTNSVPVSETARETPFTPVQFAGLAAGVTTGPELLVYLNRSGEIGQSPVDIVGASLHQGGASLAVRWVDNATQTLGPYLAGGIVIPVAPLRPHTTYVATVTVRDGGGTLTRRWHFTTA